MKNSIANSARERGSSRAASEYQDADRTLRFAKRLGGDHRGLAPRARKPERISGMPRPLAGLRRLESDCPFGVGPVPAARLRFGAASRSIPLGVLEKAAASSASAAMTVRGSGRSSGLRKAEFPHG